MQAGIKVRSKFFLLPVWFQLSDHQSTLLRQCTEFLSEWSGRAISSEALPCSYFPCLLQQQCWSLLSLSIGLRDPRLSDLTCRSFGRCTLEQSRGFPHPRLACPTGFCPQPTAKMCPNMTSETSLGATAPFSGPL